MNQLSRKFRNLGGRPGSKFPLSPSRRVSARRSLQIERFEPRQVMAAYINEIHFDPLFGDEAQDQYIELRGAPNSPLPAGTYFLAIGGSDGVYELGDVHAIFDLSGQQFGSNGLMVLMESAGGYTVDPRARLLKGTDGFLGIGSGIFSADSAGKQIRTGSNNFMLVQSSTAPTLSTDIDGNDDGVPEGAYLSWTIMDSVAVFPWVESVWKQRSYAQITFREDNVGAVMPGTTSVVTDQLAYVARIDRSTGYAADDWMAGNTVELDPAPSWKFQLQHGVFGTPRPYAYGGRLLDNVGSENWGGSISGTVFQDDNKDGVQQAGETGVAGVTVKASLNGDTTVGYDVARINPDDYPLNSDVSNALPYVTIVSAGADNVHQGFKIRVVQRSFSSPEDYIFAHEGVGFFNEDRRMRMDFYHPAAGVSIDVIGNSDLSMTYGRLEIFNAENQSLGWVRTSPLGSGQKQRLSLSSPANNIAWALAYPENSYLSSSPFGMLENLEVIIPEMSAVTDTDGNYSLPILPSGIYNLQAVKPTIYDFVSPNALGLQTVTISGNDAVLSRNFGVQGNKPPSLADQFYTVTELSAVGSALATLPVTLGYPSQQLKYTITSGDPSGIFSIDSAGQLIVNSLGLDFETRPSIQLGVKLEDVGSAALNDTAIIELLIEDGNEAPAVSSNSATISEAVTNGLSVALMTALDPDAGLAGTITWSIVSGNIGNAFAINSATGAVTVQDASQIDFEQLAAYALVVRATDKGTPTLTGQATLSISITNVNEAPILLGQALAIKENSNAGTVVGIATASDPDRNQALQWQIVGGSGSGLFDIQWSNGEITLATGAQLNFEQTAEYQVQVKVTDSGTPALSTTRTITIVVVNENDAPTLDNSSYTLAENVSPGILVGTLNGRDEDTAQTLRYSLSGSDAASFTVNELTGEIRTAPGQQCDYETKSIYLVTVTVTDNSDVPKQASATVTINLTNVNEAPTLLTTTLSVPENSPAGAKPGSLSARDEDSGDVLHWSIVSQSQNWVTINELTGELTVVAGAAINFEGTKDNMLTVRVTDSVGASVTNTITLTAADRNDPPVSTTATLGSFTVKADQLFSYTLPANTFSDPDAGDQLNMFVTLASGFPLPAWLSYNNATRLLSGTPTANEAGTVNVKFTAIDQGGASATAALSVVVDANLFPWHNSAKALDVTGDTRVTARDALLIINYLNTAGPGAVPNSAPTDGYLDTTGDNSVSARDVLLVINDLNQQAAGEGELVVDVEEVGKRKSR